MKTFYKLLFLFLFLGIYSSNAQENVGIGTKTPNQSAILDLESADKGLLIPRLTIEKRNNILSPANGLMIYQTNEKPGFYFYNGSMWKSLGEGDAKAVALDVANWSKTGDAGINPATNFLGTTDAQPLIIKTSNTERLRVTENGRVGFGTDTPLEKFHMFSGNVLVTQSVNGVDGLITVADPAGIRVGDLYHYNNEIWLQSRGGRNLNLSTTTGHVLMGTGGGNIGVGTNSPTEKLHVAGNTIITGNLTTGPYTTSNFTSRQTVNGSDGLVTITNPSGTPIGDFYNLNDQVWLQSRGNRAMVLSTGTGNIGVGTTNPTSKLHVNGSGYFQNVVKVNTTTGYLAVGDFEGGSPLTTPAGYRLIVQDGILTEKIKVALKTSGSDWADYVFEPEYKSRMMSLEDVERFTLKNKHLPNVPSADEMVKNGLDVSQTSKMFMEKIEELTLYMIELNKEVKALKAENELLKKK
jgi:hypothetical protein